MARTKSKQPNCENIMGKIDVIINKLETLNISHTELKEAIKEISNTLSEHDKFISKQQVYNTILFSIGGICLTSILIFIINKILY